MNRYTSLSNEILKLKTKLGTQTTIAHITKRVLLISNSSYDNKTVKVNQYCKYCNLTNHTTENCRNKFKQRVYNENNKQLNQNNNSNNKTTNNSMHFGVGRTIIFQQT